MISENLDEFQSQIRRITIYGDMMCSITSSSLKMGKSLVKNRHFVDILAEFQKLFQLNFPSFNFRNISWESVQDR